MNYSKKIDALDILAIESKFNYTMSESEKADTLLRYAPHNLALVETTSLGYPVKDGEYYFAFLSEDMALNVYANDWLNFLMHKEIKSNDCRNEPSLESMDLFYIMESHMLDLQKVFPSLGAGDTGSRECMLAACEHLLRNVMDIQVEISKNYMDGNSLKYQFQKD